VQDGTETKARALATATLLERWADRVPVWDPSSGERWDSYADRRHALDARLRKLPDCQLTLAAAKSDVDLTLAGVRVPRQNC